MKKHFFTFALMGLIALSSCQPNPSSKTAEGTEGAEKSSCCDHSEKTTSCCDSTASVAFFPELKSYIDSAAMAFASIDTARKETLKLLADKISADTTGTNLIFICTHNSRRSQMSQVWAQTAAAYYGIDSIKCYSGGTEATAFNPRAVKALQKAGLHIDVKDETTNPVYLVSFAPESTQLEAFSKKYDDEFNPDDFIAVMTCAQADAACPVVQGAKDRISVTYEDPKVADNTPEEEAKYDERCYQIASEMLYIFSQVKKS